MMITLYLRTFVGLIQEGGFTSAARKLGMTQPGVSQHIKALEKHYGTQLVVRNRKFVQLTPAGERLAEYARKLFREMEEFRAGIVKDDPHAGLCRFASPGSFGMRMYSFLLSLQAKHPGLVIHYEYRPNRTIITELLEDRLDVGFVTEDPKDTEIVSKVVASERLCLIVPSRCKDASFESLRKLGFINHPDGFHHASRLLELNFPENFRSMNEIPIRGFNNQITRILEPVALGMGFTALPEVAARAFPGQKKIRIVPLSKKVVDSVYRVHRRSRTLPARFDWIQKQFEQFCSGT